MEVFDKIPRLTQFEYNWILVLIFCYFIIPFFIILGIIDSYLREKFILNDNSSMLNISNSEIY